MSESVENQGVPLEGVQVADFSRLLPGPWCAQFLSDLGASVIKVEMPGTGDMSRHNPPLFDDTSVYFNSVNRGLIEFIDHFKERQYSADRQPPGWLRPGPPASCAGADAGARRRR